VYITTSHQARRQDLAAGGHIKKKVLNVCSNRWAKREMGGGRAPLPPPLATNLASHALVQSFSE